MQTHDQSKQSVSLIERLAARARIFRAEALAMPDGPERQAILKKAMQCDQAAEIDGWLRSEELTPPR